MIKLISSFEKISLRKNNKTLIFLCIFSLSSFLRFYQLDTLSPLISDQAHDYLAARDMVMTGKIPLLGIASSVPRFHQGPLYVWLLAVVFKLFAFDPTMAAYVAAFLGLLAVGLTYILAEKYFDSKIAAIAALVLAASPLAVAQSRMAFHTNAIPLFSVIYLFSLLRLLKNKNINLFWPALALFLLFQFELVTAPLLLLIPFTLVVGKIKFKKIFIAQFLSGLAIGLLPQIIFDLTHKFQQLGLFTIWIGYRLASFVGIFSEHTTSPSKLFSVAKIILEYLQRFFFWQSGLLTLLIIGLMAISVFFYWSKRLRKILIYPKQVLVLIWIALMLGSFFILGNASEAYFPALFVPIAILVGISISSIKSQLGSRLAFFVLIFISTLNSIFLIRNSFLVGSLKSGNPFNTYGASLFEQQQIADFIAGKTSGPISLRAIGPGSQFPSYLDNTRFLLWQRHQIVESESGAQVWIQPISTTARPVNTVHYQFDTTVVSFPFKTY